MKKNHLRLLTLAAMLSATIGLSAQVRIGGRTPNTPGSLLDLNSPTKGTVLFPRVFIDDLDFIPNSIGAHPDSLDVNYNLAGSVVFNTNPATVTGMYLWDGEYWLKIDTADKPLPPPNPYAYCSTLYAAPADKTGKTAQLIFGNATGDTLTFLTYNLGADPSLTPFQQMTYNSAVNSANIPFDLRVNGGLFQWGRKDFRHAFRCQKEDGVNDDMFSNTQLDYPTVVDDGKFVFGYPDWVTTQQDSLWDSSQPGYTGFNDPCPSGFHVPTRSQWTTFADNSKIYWTNLGGSFSTQKYVAIPVENGTWNNSFPSVTAISNNYPANCGFAIYTDTAYNALNSAGSGNGTNLTIPESFNGTLHEPVLFLPAGGFRIYAAGEVYFQGYGGYYWGSTVSSSDNAHCLDFNSIVTTTSAVSRAFGLAVRCLAELSDF